jgi:hypothetical protein
MSTNKIPLRPHRARRHILLSSPAASEDINLYLANLPPSDPPSEVSSDNERDPQFAVSSEDIPLHEILKREVERESSPLDFRTLLQRLIRRHRRSSSLPAEATVPILSSDDTVIFTPRTERQLCIEASQAKRADTISRNRGKADEEAAEEMEREALMKKTAKDREDAECSEVFDDILANLQQRRYSLADFLDYVFNPANTHAFDWRWKGFFAYREAVERILGYWTTARYNNTTCTFINGWAISHVKKVTAKESAKTTESGILRKTTKDVNEDFFLSYSLAGLTKTLRELAPNTFAVLDAISTTPRQVQKLSDEWFKKKEIVS